MTNFANELIEACRKYAVNFPHNKKTNKEVLTNFDIRHTHPVGSKYNTVTLYDKNTKQQIGLLKFPFADIPDAAIAHSVKVRFGGHRIYEIPNPPKIHHGNTAIYI